MPRIAVLTSSNWAHKTCYNSLMKKILSVLLIIVVVLVGFYMTIGYWFINPVLGSIMTKLRPTPQYKSILTDYKVNGFNVSLSSPYALFAFEVKKNPQGVYPQVENGTGLINLETQEVVVLTEKNWIPLSTSSFSPNGKRLIYAIKTDEKRHTNEYGNWVSQETFDVYVRSLADGGITKIASKINTNEEDYIFGWISDKNMYYSCPSIGAGFNLSAYCVVNLDSMEMNVIRSDYDRKPPTNFTDSYPDKSKLNYGGISLDGSLSLTTRCLLGQYDGCAYSTIYISDGNKEWFIGNRDNNLGEFVWAYGNRLYRLIPPSAYNQNGRGILQIR